MGIVSGGGGGGAAFNGGTITQPLVVNAVGADVAAAVYPLRVLHPSWDVQNPFDVQVNKDGASNADTNVTFSAEGTGVVSADFIESTYDGEVALATNAASFVAPRTGYTGDVFYAGVAGAKTLRVASTGLGFYAHAAAAQQTLTSGTATPEQIALALQATGLCGGT